MRTGICITLKPGDRRRLAALARDRNAPQVDRQLLAWRSVLVRTERLPQLHRIRDHSSHPTLRHWQRQEVEHLLGFEAIRGLWITRLLGLGTGQRIATVAIPHHGLET